MHLSTLLLSYSLHFLSVSCTAITSPPTNLITLSTINNTFTSALTIPIPECVRITDPPMLGLNPSNCEIAVPIICKRLTHAPVEQLRRDVWIWTELPGCSLGYYLPEEAHVPYEGPCNRIFEWMVELCSTDSKFNAGGINVLELPDFSGPGSAVREENMRYAMAPERLTLPS